MLALLKDVPFINHPAFRLVLGAALIAAGLALHAIIVTAAGGLLLLMGAASGYTVLTSRSQKGQVR
jgi:hypothetical protein